jgi:hypothetical protein
MLRYVDFSGNFTTGLVIFPDTTFQISSYMLQITESPELKYHSITYFPQAILYIKIQYFFCLCL